MDKKAIPYRESNGEIITACFFDNCDQDSRSNEGHLYFHAETGQYHCKKCNASGNIFTLAKYLDSTTNDLVLHPKQKLEKVIKNKMKLDISLIDRCSENIPERIHAYLNTRGIGDEIIEKRKLGFGKFYGKNWITIPIPDNQGSWAFLKLRRDPEDKDNPDKYKFYPTGSGSSLYGVESIGNAQEVWICEGEFDQMILTQQGITAITSTAGAGTFKREWTETLVRVPRVVICFDNDKAGKDGMDRIVKVLEEELENTSIFRANLPEDMGNGADISNYFGVYGGNKETLLSFPFFTGGKEPIDTSKFLPLSSQDLIEILGLTIKQDNHNKLATFLCELSAYTESSQFNISFNAPSSTGKSYIPTEIAQLFPKEDVMEIGYCSPTSFFHDNGHYNKEREGTEIDLSRKILIFLDQPHTQLLERLRPLLSHDKKEMTVKITDKSQKMGMKTKTIFIKGYPAVIFCSAGILIDEQEGTRFLLLSPEANREKVYQGIHEKILRETDPDTYYQTLENNEYRVLLKERILAIRSEHVEEILLPDDGMIEQVFMEGKMYLKPRHQRDIGRFIAFVRMFALLNMWFREKKNGAIMANETDIREAIELWRILSESQEYNLPPYVFDLYKHIILEAFYEKNKGSDVIIGLTKHDILKKYQAIHGRFLEDWRLRQQIMPLLEASGLIEQEPDISDKRKILFFPRTEKENETKRNSESDGGVNNENEEISIQEALDIFGGHLV
ncbi:MAG: toprim domain-containing protein [Candidatus Moranbacteria bacterium]|nr:toprim domain-containing protein [Candidatus Moranbacteria bacterium]